MYKHSSKKKQNKIMIECNDKPFVTRELNIKSNGSYSTIGYDQANVDVAGCDIYLSNGLKFGYSNFSEIPNCDYSKATSDVSHMFTNCKNITDVHILNLQGVTNMNSMFNSCTSLQNVSLSDTSFVTSMRVMFQNCNSLKSVQLSDTSNVTDMWYMFYGCAQLEEIIYLDTSKATDMTSIFANCTALTTLPQLDASKLQNTGISSMFQGCKSLTNFGGLKNVGQSFSTSVSSQISFANSPNLSDESIQNIIDGLYDRTGVTYTTSLILHPDVKAKLTDAQKQQITNKNWTVAL